MAYKITSFVEEEKVPRLRRKGNEDTAEIVAQLIAAADEGNTAFAFIPVPDKTDRVRLANSIRNQVKLRGYDYEKVTGTKLRRLKSGQTELIEGIYVRATPAPESPAPVKRAVKEEVEAAPKRRRNGTA